MPARHCLITPMHVDVDATGWVHHAHSDTPCDSDTSACGVHSPRPWMPLNSAARHFRPQLSPGLRMTAATCWLPHRCGSCAWIPTHPPSTFCRLRDERRSRITPAARTPAAASIIDYQRLHGSATRPPASSAAAGAVDVINAPSTLPPYFPIVCCCLMVNSVVDWTDMQASHPMCPLVLHTGAQLCLRAALCLA